MGINLLIKAQDLFVEMLMEYLQKCDPCYTLPSAEAMRAQLLKINQSGIYRDVFFRDLLGCAGLTMTPCSLLCWVVSTMWDFHRKFPTDTSWEVLQLQVWQILFAIAPNPKMADKAFSLWPRLQAQLITTTLHIC